VDIAPSERYYYFRVDGSRREPDPLARWAQSDGGTVLSIVGAPDKLAERPPWSGLLLR